MKRINLKDALKTGKLEEFIKQEESRGIGPVDKKVLEDEIKRLIKQSQSKDQT